MLTLFVFSTKDGWVALMYQGIDAVGVDKQVSSTYSISSYMQGGVDFSLSHHTAPTSGFLKESFSFLEGESFVILGFFLLFSHKLEYNARF